MGLHWINYVRMVKKSLQLRCLDNELAIEKLLWNAKCVWIIFGFSLETIFRRWLQIKSPQIHVHVVVSIAS